MVVTLQRPGAIENSSTNYFTLLAQQFCSHRKLFIPFSMIILIFSTMHHGRIKEESLKQLRLFTLEKIPGRPYNCLKNKALLPGPQDRGKNFKLTDDRFRLQKKFLTNGVLRHWICCPEKL